MTGYQPRKKTDGFAEFLHFVVAGALGLGAFPFWRRGFVRIGVPDVLSWPLTVIVLVVWVAFVLDFVKEIGAIKGVWPKIGALLFAVAAQVVMILLAIAGGAHLGE